MSNNIEDTQKLSPITEDQALLHESKDEVLIRDPLNVDSVDSKTTKPAPVFAAQAFSQLVHKTAASPPQEVPKLPAIRRDEEFDFSDEEEPEKQSKWDIARQNLTENTYRAMCKRLRTPVRSSILRQLQDCAHNISLRRMCLPSREVKAVCTALLYHNRAYSLDLNGNRMASEGIQCVTQLLSQNHHFTSLTLSESALGGEALKYLARDIASMKHLRDLDISSCQITDLDAYSLEKLITNNDVLLTLNLSRNELRQQAAESIASALAQNRCLEMLDLSWNHLRGAGAVAIAKGITLNQSVTSLALSWNGFGYEGCSALGHALAHNSTLTDLDLSSNRIHPHALFRLVEGLYHNSSLEILKLADNPIPAVYTSPLLVKMSQSPTSALSYLDLTGTVVDETFEKVLANFQDKRAIQVKYGRALPVHRRKWANREKELYEAPKIHNIDPIRVFYHIKNNLRCIDFLAHIDRDNSFDLSREEIDEALKKANLQLSSSSLDMIMQYLDSNKDGRIDLLELINGERKMRRRLLALKKSVSSLEAKKHSEALGARSLTVLDDTLYDLVEKACDPLAKLFRASNRVKTLDTDADKGVTLPNIDI